MLCFKNYLASKGMFKVWQVPHLILGGLDVHAAHFVQHVTANEVNV